MGKEMQILEPGQVFAERYRIERRLAEGGMGAVFVAEQIATEMRVALKVLWPQVLASRTAVEKFQTEAKVAARVDSEHIVRVFDAGFDEATRLPFLAMELLSGFTLEELVRNDGPLSPESAVLYLRQVAMGLDKAHNYVDKEGVPRGIIHRDLKPENLFLTHRESGEPVVKILDFGIAKVVSQTTAVSREVRGTPLYMAVEQAMGTQVTPQTDIWAMGLIAYFLLTGKSYWRTAADPDAGLSALLTEVLTLPLVTASDRLRATGVTPPWSDAFDEWFLRCVNRDPTRRFRSAGAAAAALAKALLQIDVDSSQRLVIAGGSGFGFASHPALAPTSVRTSDSAISACTPVVRNPGPGQTMEQLALSRTSRRSESNSARTWVLAIVAAAILLGMMAALVGFTMRSMRQDPAGVEPDSTRSASESSAPPFPTNSSTPSAAPKPSVAAEPKAPISTTPLKKEPGPPATTAVVTTPPTSTTKPPPTSPNPSKTSDDIYGER